MKGSGRNPMRVLVTGGAGFIGSHLAEHLLERGHLVDVVDDLSTGRLENVQPLLEHPSFHLEVDTVMNSTLLSRMMKSCDAVVHLAAAVGVQLIVSNPVGTIETNEIGRAHV